MDNSNYGFIAGLGMNFNLKRLGINVDIRYKQALNNINNKDNRFINNGFNEVFVYGFYDALDDIKLREVELSVGIVYHLNYKAFKQ